MKRSFAARTAHSCGSDASVTFANLCLGGSWMRVPALCYHEDCAAGYYVVCCECCAPGSGGTQTEACSFTDCFSLCICGWRHLINHSRDHSWGFFHPAPTLLGEKKIKIKVFLCFVGKTVLRSCQLLIADNLLHIPCVFHCFKRSPVFYTLFITGSLSL